MSDEVRTTSATGAEKGVKPERLDLLPVYPLIVAARHYARGAEKYDDHNWRKGYEWSKSYGALQRHLNAFWDGEDIDEETGSPHLAAAFFHVCALIQFTRDFPEYDDRYKPEPELSEEDIHSAVYGPPWVPEPPSGWFAPVDERYKGTALERVHYWADQLDAYDHEADISDEDLEPFNDATDKLEQASKDLVEHGPDWVRPPQKLGPEWTEVGFTTADEGLIGLFQIRDQRDLQPYQNAINEEIRNLAAATVTPFDLLTSPLNVSVELTDVPPETIRIATGADLRDDEIDEGDPSTLSWREAMRRCLNDLFNRRD